MIIRKREFFIGLVLLASFLVVLAVLLSPVMNGKTVIAYADDLFNQLTKGSTYYIPGMVKKAKSFEGQEFQVTVRGRDAQETSRMAGLFTSAGLAVQLSGQSLSVSGDLGKAAARALADADAEFKNQGAQVKERYGLESREVIYYWWGLFDALEKSFKLQGRATEMSFASAVKTKALEPAYNFEGIEAARVADKAGITAFMLVFYVIYTVWYGFAMLFIFEGLGITASAHGEKQEA